MNHGRFFGSWTLPAGASRHLQQPVSEAERILGFLTSGPPAQGSEEASKDGNRWPGPRVRSASPSFVEFHEAADQTSQRRQA